MSDGSIAEILTHCLFKANDILPPRLTPQMRNSNQRTEFTVEN